MICMNSRRSFFAKLAGLFGAAAAAPAIAKEMLAPSSENVTFKALEKLSSGLAMSYSGPEPNLDVDYRHRVDFFNGEQSASVAPLFIKASHWNSRFPVDKGTYVSLKPPFTVRFHLQAMPSLNRRGFLYVRESRVACQNVPLQMSCDTAVIVVDMITIDSPRIYEP